MPRLWFVIVDNRSVLVASRESVEVGIFLHPFDISAISGIREIFGFRGGIEEVECKSELMFASSGNGTERSSFTSAEIPESLLVFCTAKGTDCNERFSKMFVECLGKSIEMRFDIRTNEARSPCLIDMASRDGYEIFRTVVDIVESDVAAYVTQDTVVFCDISDENRSFQREE